MEDVGLQQEEGEVDHPLLQEEQVVEQVAEEILRYYVGMILFSVFVEVWFRLFMLKPDFMIFMYAISE